MTYLLCQSLWPIRHEYFIPVRKIPSLIMSIHNATLACESPLPLSLYSCRNKPKIHHNIGQHVLPIVSQAVDIIDKIKVFDLFWSFGVENSYGFWISVSCLHPTNRVATVSEFHCRPTYCLPLWRFVGSYAQGVSRNKPRVVLTVYSRYSKVASNSIHSEYHRPQGCWY